VSAATPVDTLAPGRRADSSPPDARPGGAGLVEPATPAGLERGPAETLAARAASALAAPWLMPWALAAVTFSVFLPTLWNDFVEWDDYVNLFENPHYRGLGWAQLRWMFTSTLMGHYIPVSWLSFGLDYTLWGMNPVGYHLTNNVLHAANAGLFCLVARRLLAAADGGRAALGLAAAMATGFFALHPLRAESVAWATERRDVLSGLFFLLSVWCYLSATDGRVAGRRSWLAASVGCFGLGLLSKSIIMTLPLCLLILDVYPLRRLSWQPWRWGHAAARRVLIEKAPFLAVGAAGAAVSYWAVAHNDYLTPLGQYPWPARIGMTFYSYWFYLWKTLWPGGLSPLYELPLAVDPLAPRFLGAAAGVVLVTAAALVLAARVGWPAPLAAWLYYGVFLGPVTGIVHAGHQLTHDRYSYLSCLGFALLFGSAVGAMAENRLAGLARPALVRAAAAAAAAWILALGLSTWYQVQIWRDSESLWRFAVEADPECSICHSNLGILLVREHQAYALGRDHLERTLALRPDRHRTRANYGLTLSHLGETDRAIEQLHLALAHFPNDADALSNLAGILIGRRSYAEALVYLERARAVKPNHSVVLANLGALFVETGRAREAVGLLRRSIELKPQEPVTRILLARAHLALGEFDQANEVYASMTQMDARVLRRLSGGLVWH
jgi:Flp pilus assembly protein TadD